MTLEEYQDVIQQFVRYAPTAERQYLALGLVAEIGELSGKFAKRLRSDFVSDADVIAELGDILWFVRMIRNRYRANWQASVKTIRIRHADDAIGKLFEFGQQVYSDMQRDTVAPVYLCLIEDVIEHLAKLHGVKSLADLATENFDKLQGRAERGVIVGSGDAR